jgi:hypothetical protein
MVPFSADTAFAMDALPGALTPVCGAWSS